MIDINKLKIKIFADGADINGISELNKKKFIKGFTTNPSLMRKSGVEDYKKFAFEVLKIVNDKPVSFEVFADDINQMEEQAYEIASWGKNANVKIPITNTKGDSTVQLIKKLSNSGVICNVTAIFTTEQLNSVVEVLKSDTPAILSVFAGRIADSGIDPMSIMQQSVTISKKKNKSSVLWASTREIINIFQAENAGCQIITVPNNILKKIPGIGKDLKENSLDTVSMFYKDALAAGYKIDVKK